MGSYFTRIRPYQNAWRVDVYARYGRLTRLVAVGLGSLEWATSTADSPLLLVAAVCEEQLGLGSIETPAELLPDDVDDLSPDGAPLNSEYRIRVAGELASKKPSGTYAKGAG